MTTTSETGRAPEQPGDESRPDPRDSRADDLAAEIEADRLPPGDWPARRSVPVSVLIPAKNEESNIVETLRHLQFASQIVVVDSQSTDRTIPLAQAMGADVHQFYISPEGWPKKRNWALANLPWANEWVFIMDADEHCTPELAHEIEQVVTGAYPDAKGCGDGYWINRRFMFLGRWIKHCGYYPSWNVRLFKHAVGRYERIGMLGDTGSGDNEVHEHIVLETGEPGYLKHDFLHYAYPDLTTWIEKHNRYSTWEAYAAEEGDTGGIEPRFFGGGEIARRRWIKQHARKLPCRSFLRFLHAYVFRLGFLDGWQGFTMCRLLGWYEFVSHVKQRELRMKRGVGKDGAS